MPSVLIYKVKPAAFCHMLVYFSRTKIAKELMLKAVMLLIREIVKNMKKY